MKKPNNNIYLLYAFCDIVPLKSYKFWLKPFKVSYGNIGYLMKFNFVSLYCHNLKLSISRRRPLAYRNESIDLQSKSMDWFLYDNGLRHGRVKLVHLHHLKFSFKSGLLNSPHYICTSWNNQSQENFCCTTLTHPDVLVLPVH